MDYKEILEHIVNKDKKGLEALYVRYGKRYYQFAVNQWHLTEDDAWKVVYQTLETLILKLPNYTIESEEHFDNLIFKIFVNFLRQFFRSHRTHQYDIVYVDFNMQESAGNETDEETLREEGESLPDEDAKNFLPVDDQLVNRLYEAEVSEDPRLMLFKQALSLLKSDEQSILLLKAQDYSYDEIAEMLGIENNQMKVRHHRLKNKLKKLFENLLNNDHGKAK